MPADADVLSICTVTRYTVLTFIDPDLLLEERTHTKTEGFGVDHEEFLPGMVALAVPVFVELDDTCLP